VKFRPCILPPLIGEDVQVTAVRLPPRRSLREHALRFVDSKRRSAAPISPEMEDRIEWPRLIPFALMHLGCLGVFVTGASTTAVVTCVVLYALRMFSITAFYHRYLSHRSFQAPRWLVFLGAMGATAAAQRGPLWWAAHHRKHHRYSDREGDAHSPHGEGGFWWSHIGWFTTRRNFRTDEAQVRDLAAFPELRWLDRFDILVPIGLLVALGVAGALLAEYAPSLGTSASQMMVWGFCISTTAVFHATSAVNSLSHLIGRRTFPTRDHSRNSLWIALLTFGEGWHNNHHWCPGSVRQGFRWWQVDLSFYVLWVLSLLRITKLGGLPERARRNPGSERS
jgi:stearoyl-CoA desaturase (delta-9 desaturase)